MEYFRHAAADGVLHADVFFDSGSAHLTWCCYEVMVTSFKTARQRARKELGMSSTELNKPPANWKEIFAEAEKVGIRRPAQAAEERPAQYIADSLDILHVERIDHGRRLVEDPALMKEWQMRG
jgi:adenosine deaminase